MKRYLFMQNAQCGHCDDVMMRPRLCDALNEGCAMHWARVDEWLRHEC
jgi:hypothetical protein